MVEVTSPKSTSQTMRSQIQLAPDPPQATPKAPPLKMTSMGQEASTKQMAANERRVTEQKSTIVFGGDTPRVQAAPAAPSPLHEPRRTEVASKNADQKSSVACLSPTEYQPIGKPSSEPQPASPNPEYTKKTKPLAEHLSEPEPAVAHKVHDPRKKCFPKAAPNPTNKTDELRSVVCLGDDLSASSLEPSPMPHQVAVQAEPAEPPSFVKKTRASGGSPDKLQSFQQMESQINLALPANAFVGADVQKPAQWDGTSDQFRAASQAEAKIIGTKCKQSNPFNLPPSQKPIPIAAVAVSSGLKSFPWKNSARRPTPASGQSSSQSGTITAPTMNAADYKLTQRKDETPAATTSVKPPPGIMKPQPSPGDMRLNLMKGSVVLGGAASEK